MIASLQEVIPHLSAYKQNKLEELQKKLAATTQTTKSRHKPKEEDTVSLGKGQGSREQIKSDIDDIIACECVYCGELMIKSIDKPFIDPQKFDQEMSSWLWRTHFTIHLCYTLYISWQISHLCIVKVVICLECYMLN